MLYHSNLAKYATNKWLFTTARSGTSITNNISYSGQAIDSAGNTSAINAEGPPFLLFQGSTARLQEGQEQRCL